MRLIAVDREKICELAKFFVAPPKSQGFESEVVPMVKASSESLARAMLWAAAICHSTKSGLGGDLNGTFYHGWDYLLRTFCLAAEADEYLVSPASVGELRADGLLALLTSRATNPRVTLVDLDKRSDLLRQLAAELNRTFDGSVLALLERSRGKAGGEEGAYHQLASLSAFQDPLRKKSSVFLMALHFSRLWRAEDGGELLPMIDYHRIRLLCRMGCIAIEECIELAQLRGRVPVSQEFEELLRRAAFDVCRTIIDLSGCSVFEFDMLLWAHARSCCRHMPVCVSGTLEDSSFYRFLDKAFEGRCEFQEWCGGARDAGLRDIWEPIVSTEHY